MKGGAQAAFALGVGYVLGRRRKMRLATMLALGTATDGIGLRAKSRTLGLPWNHAFGLAAALGD
jgi:hypothetical protein